MQYFTIEQEFNYMDLVEHLLGYADTKSKTILSQEYQLEEVILDTLDMNIGENVDPYECIIDIEDNPKDYINAMLDNVDKDYREDLAEELEHLK